MKREEKYKIVENRPELTSEQVRAGMDFQSMQKKIPASEKSFLKSALLAVAIAASLVAGYFLFHFLSPKQGPQKIEGATIDKDTINSADTVEMISSEVFVFDLVPLFLSCSR